MRSNWYNSISSTALPASLISMAIGSGSVLTSTEPLAGIGILTLGLALACVAKLAMLIANQKSHLERGPVYIDPTTFKAVRLNQSE